MEGSVGGGGTSGGVGAGEADGESVADASASAAASTRGVEDITGNLRSKQDSTFDLTQRLRDRNVGTLQISF